MSPTSWRLIAVVCLVVSATLIVWNSRQPIVSLVESRRHESLQSTLHDLSSSSLVQRAAADCAVDSKCIPTVDELVNRAAAACASDPRCVCDWAKYPKKCFLSEVARHKQLTHDAKELVSLLHTREERKARQLQGIKAHNAKFNQLLAEGRHDLETNDIAGAKEQLVKAEVQHKLTERSSDGHLDLHIPVDQTDALEAFARQIVVEERAKAARASPAPVSNAVTKQLAVLSSQIKLLMKKVASRSQPAARPEQNQQSSQSNLPLSTAEQIRELTQDVARLTGKVGQLQQARTMSTSSGRMQQLSDAPALSPHYVSHHRDVEHERALAVKQQDRALAAALKRGKLAVEDGNPLKAKTALSEVEYYRKALARLKGEYSPCEACDRLKQEVSSLSTELSTPASSTELSESPAEHPRRSATALEKSFDSYLSVGDQALVHDHFSLAQKALRRATGRFAELETMKLPGADAVIKHEMRDALRALRDNIRSQQKQENPSSEAGKGDDAPATATLRHHEHENTRRERALRRYTPHAATYPRSSAERRRGHAGGGKEGVRMPGSSALLREMLKRPGYYDAKTLRLATEGLDTATMQADGTLQALLSPSALRRIKRHFVQA